jgi:hypothetical protein
MFQNSGFLAWFYIKMTSSTHTSLRTSKMGKQPLVKYPWSFCGIHSSSWELPLHRQTSKGWPTFLFGLYFLGWKSSRIPSAFFPTVLRAIQKQGPAWGVWVRSETSENHMSTYIGQQCQELKSVCTPLSPWKKYQKMKIQIHKTQSNSLQLLILP